MPRKAGVLVQSVEHVQQPRFRPPPISLCSGGCSSALTTNNTCVRLNALTCLLSLEAPAGCSLGVIPIILLRTELERIS